MGISINIQRIKQVRARKISDYFSTVDVTSDTDLGTYCANNEVSLFLEGPGHTECAKQIAQLINEQIARRDAPPVRNDERAVALAADDAAYDEEDQLAAEAAAEEHNAQFTDSDQAAIDRAKYERDDDLPF